MNSEVRMENICVTKTQMKYLTAIKSLTDARKNTRQVDIANALNSSRASVSIAIPKLLNLGLVRMEEDALCLTENGKIAVENPVCSAQACITLEKFHNSSIDGDKLLASENAKKLDVLKVTKPEKKYLLYIAELSRNRKLRKTDLASEMGFSRSAVSIAVPKLEAAGLIRVDENGCIELSKTVSRYLGM